jgi:hypothetical protein
LAAISRLRQELRPEFVQPKIQAVAEEALKRLEPFEANRVSRLEGELGRLLGQVPKEPTLSPIEENSQVLRDLFVLTALGAELLADPLRLRIAYLDALQTGNLHVAGAIERDPMGRAGRALSDQDRHRGRVARGLSASPDLQRRIDGYEGMVRRYRQRFGALRRHLEGEGWMPPDPLIQMAGRSEGS